MDRLRRTDLHWPVCDTARTDLLAAGALEDVIATFEREGRPYAARLVPRPAANVPA